MTILLILSVLAGPDEFDLLSAQLHVETGDALLQQGLLEQAEQEFRYALDAVPDCPSAILGLGRVYAACSSIGPAEELFREFVALAPDDYRGFYELAVLMLGTGRPDSAFAMSDSAFVRAPGNPDVWMLSGRTAIAAADTLAAERWFLRGLQDPGPVGLESRTQLATLYRATGRSTEARELLLPAAQSGYAPAWWGLAMVYLSWNDFMRGVDAIGNYLTLAPEGAYADSAVLVLQALAESGDYIAPD